MEPNEQKQAEPFFGEREAQIPQKLPQAWQRFLDAVRRHYGPAADESSG